MAYDENLAQRISDVLAGQANTAEKKMMGGLVFMVHGNMCCGVSGESLMVRVGSGGREAALTRAHTRPMEFGGRSPKGFIFVDREGIKSATALAGWVQRGLDFVATLPAK